MKLVESIKKLLTDSMIFLQLLLGFDNYWQNCCQVFITSFPIILLKRVLPFTAWKLSVFGVFWSVFSRIETVFNPNAGKYGPENSKYGQFSRSAAPSLFPIVSRKDFWGVEESIDNYNVTFMSSRKKKSKEILPLC